MALRSTIMAVLRRTPASWRRTAKNALYGLPGYSRKVFYGSYGEDAFLQSYYREKTQRSQATEAMMSLFLRRRSTPGFYVDIGAHHPMLQSNTRWFYARGWHGVNIDAAPGSMKAFARLRRRDANVQALVSDSAAPVTFLHWPESYDFSTVTTKNADYSTLVTGKEPQQIAMTPRRLADILAEHVPEGSAIDFMSVDVEGHEISVLRSNDWQRFRPELVLVEDHGFRMANPERSAVYTFMQGVGYELYAWVRPTLVFRQCGLYDWLSAPEYSAQR